MSVNNNPERQNILSTNLEKLINNESIDKIKVDVKITDTLETIPSWNIVARIWNKSHLDSTKVAESLLEAVKIPNVLHQLDTKQLNNLSLKLSGILSKFTNIHDKNRRSESINHIIEARDLVSKEINRREAPKSAKSENP